MCDKLNFLVNVLVGASSFLKFSNFIGIITCQSFFIFFHSRKVFNSIFYSCHFQLVSCSSLGANEWSPHPHSLSLCAPSLLPLSLISTLLTPLSAFFPWLGVTSQACLSSLPICVFADQLLFAASNPVASALCGGMLPLEFNQFLLRFSVTLFSPSIFHAWFHCEHYSTSLKVKISCWNFLNFLIFSEMLY